MPESAPSRVFLVVVDETPEHRIAVRYAARRAAHTGGRLAMLYVIEPTELQHFRAIEELALAERREERRGAAAAALRGYRARSPARCRSSISARGGGATSCWR